MGKRVLKMRSWARPLLIPTLAVAALIGFIDLRQPVLAAATRPTSGDELLNFEFHGQVIHPACVMKLGTELADMLPVVAAIDVEGCTESQQSPAAFAVRHGWVRIELAGGGWFAYQHLGVSPDGIHVLHTQCSGGGTGVFEDLLMVRFNRDRVRQDNSQRDRLVMTSVGSFVLGDRDDGKIRFDRNRIVIGRSRYRTSEKVILLDEDR